MPLILCLLVLSFFSSQLQAEVEIEYELDPYYSNVGLYIPFNDNPIPTVELKNEPDIYFNLLQDALTPRFFVIELSVNPLPILGVYLNKNHKDFYDQADISNDLNLIAALTEGFEEPYALSFFLGNVIKFNLPDQKDNKAVNKGYSGLLLSLGDHHIRSNTLINDKWHELEWKLKGDRRLGDIYHSFSFRVGLKEHQNQNIEDSFYFGIRRELFNSTIADYRYYENIGIDFRVDFSQETQHIIQAQLFIDKHWPTDKGELTFGIGLQKVDQKYLGPLSHLNQDVQLILRPGIKF